MAGDLFFLIFHKRFTLRELISGLWKQTCLNNSRCFNHMPNTWNEFQKTRIPQQSAIHFYLRVIIKNTTNISLGQWSVCSTMPTQWRKIICIRCSSRVNAIFYIIIWKSLARIRCQITPSLNQCLAETLFFHWTLNFNHENVIDDLSTRVPTFRAWTDRREQTDQLHRKNWQNLIRHETTSMRHKSRYTSIHKLN